MVKYIEWYNNTFPLNIQPEDTVTKLLNSGCVYVYGRDHHFRPLLIVQPSIIQKWSNKCKNSDDIINTGIFLCQFICNHMLIPGQIENWSMIINLYGVSVVSLPDPIKKMIPILSEGFVKHLYKSYIFGMSFFLRILYTIFSAFLEDVTKKKMIVLKGKNDPRILNDINTKNLEKKFGGEIPNVEYDIPNCLFPPRMPSDYFFTEKDNPNEILISENEYIQRYKKGLIPKQSVSPYILEKLKKEKRQEQKKKLLEQKENYRKRVLEFRKSKVKSKSQINLGTSWKPAIENFDVGKFVYKKNNNINNIKAFGFVKSKFYLSLAKLNDDIGK